MDILFHFSNILFLIILFILLLAILEKLKRILTQKLRENKERIYRPIIEKFITGNLSLDDILEYLRTKSDIDIIVDMLFNYVSYFTGDLQNRIIEVFENLGVVDKYIKKLNYGNKIEKCLAAYRLGKIKSEKAFPYLIKALEDKNDDVKLVAANSLGYFKKQDAFISLIRILGILDLFKAESIAEIIIEIIKNNEDNLLYIMNLLKEKNYKLKYWAIYILGETKYIKSISEIEKLLKEPDEKIRVQAAISLGKIGDPSVYKSLCLSLTDPSWKVRKESVVSLGKLGHPDAILSLTVAIMDRNWDVNIEVCSALIKLDNTLNSFVNLLESNNVFVRRRAAEVLETNGILDRYINEIPGSDDNRINEIMKILEKAGRNGAMIPLIDNRMNQNEMIKNRINKIIETIKK